MREVIVHFVDIDGIVDHHCFNFLFIIDLWSANNLYPSLKIWRKLVLHVCFPIYQIHHKLFRLEFLNKVSGLFNCGPNKVCVVYSL
jgi:uncharacterized membrane protein YagU involved in acid resistance